jgi:hypothetical protein
LKNESHKQIARKSREDTLRTASALPHCLKNGFSIFESPISNKGYEYAISARSLFFPASQAMTKSKVVANIVKPILAKENSRSALCKTFDKRLALSCIIGQSFSIFLTTERRYQFPKSRIISSQKSNYDVAKKWRIEQDWSIEVYQPQMFQGASDGRSQRRLEAIYQMPFVENHARSAPPPRCRHEN